jgi:uncharacterized YigZ family protein
MVTSFKTLGNRCEGTFKDRGSKFLAFGFPVSDEDEVRSKLEETRKKYHDARHHCYAWRLGEETVTERANDDGEPGNSAGKPILNQLIKFELTNVLVVVVRYFGGTLLGVGGLINAYRSATEDALSNARIVEIERKASYSISFGYEQMNAVMSIIKEFEIDVLMRDFGNSCKIHVSLSLQQEKEIISRFGIIPVIEVKKRS